MAVFWKKRFELPATASQRWFDCIFGIIAPILCLIFDPAIFRSGFPAGVGFLSEYRPFAYVAITFSIVALAYYLLRQSGYLPLVGILVGGGIFSLVLGLAMLPMTAIGLFILIGVFGLTPFVTSFVFLRNGYRAWRGSPANHGSPALASIAIGLLLVIGIPLATHVSYTHTVRKALTEISSGSEQEYSKGVSTLKWLRYDTDQVAVTYQKCSDSNQRARLSRAYTDLTGKAVEDRLGEIAD